MSIHFYSFTDPSELDRYEVCWTQAQATADAKADQHAPEIPAAPNSARPPVPLRYGQPTDLFRRALNSAGDRPLTLRDFREAYGMRAKTVHSVAREAVLKGSAVRLRPGVYQRNR